MVQSIRIWCQIEVFYTVTVRTFSGNLPEGYVNYSEESELLLEGEYLFYLYQLAGLGINADDGSYYALGLSQSVFRRVQPEDNWEGIFPRAAEGGRGFRQQYKRL